MDDVYRRALLLHPTDFMLNFDYAYTLECVNRPEEAMGECRAALARGPRRSLSMLGLARAAARAGDGTTAEDTYAELATIWHRADVVYPPAVEARNGGVTPSVARQESKR